MKEHAILGIDIGTTSVKVVAFDFGGKTLAQASTSYDLFHPRPGFSEQDPMSIRQATFSCIKTVAASVQALQLQIEALSFSAVMHSVMAVTDDGEVLTPLITWADNRSAPEMDRIRADLGLAVYKRTGTPLHPMSPLAKIAWLKTHRADLFRPGVRFVSIKEWIVYVLCGIWRVDHSTASATGMFNLASLAFDQEALQYNGLSADQLSEPVDTLTMMPLHDSDLARALGLTVNLPVVIGATDGVLANLGTGVIAAGQVAVTMGTSGAVRITASEPWTDDLGRTFCYALTKDYWVIGGAVNNGGIATRWLTEMLTGNDKSAFAAAGARADSAALGGRGDHAFGEADESWLFHMASKVPAGAGGLLFLPYLTGERAPYFHEHARGVFFGFGVEHTREHMARAAVEGIVYALYNVGVVISERHAVQSLHVSGGFARSKLWRSLVCNIFGVPLQVPSVDEVSCFGAALLGLHALGEFSSLQDAAKLIVMRDGEQPNGDDAKTYQKYYPLFASVYENLKDSFDVLARMRDL